MCSFLMFVWGICVGAWIGAALAEYLRKPVVHYHVDNGYFNVMAGATLTTAAEAQKGVE
jgi:hypothetical protein